MTLDAFARACSLLGLSELEKVRHLAYYHHKAEGKTEFTLDDVASWFAQLGLARPNTSRLRTRLRESRSFVLGSTGNSHRLHAVDLDELQAAYPGLSSQSEDVTSDDTLLPRPLYEGTRGFIEALARQINASYEYNIFDGCAVLMRRLAEVLLILAYEHSNTESEIQDATGNYVGLEKIIDNARNNATLRLSRNTKGFLDQLRTLGNFAAHKIYFTTRRRDIQGISTEYRAMVEELLYKAGIKV